MSATTHDHPHDHDHAHGHVARLRAALAVQHQPQGYRHPLPDLRPGRRRPPAAVLSEIMRAQLLHPHGSTMVTSGQEWNTIVTTHGLLMIFFSVMPALDRRVRQLVRPAHDRRAGHGVPAPQQHQLLAAAAGLRADRGRAAAGRVRAPAGRCIRRCRMPPTSPASAWTSRCSRCIWPASPRCSARSTSSPPSSTCARRA